LALFSSKTLVNACCRKRPRFTALEVLHFLVVGLLLLGTSPASPLLFLPCCSRTFLPSPHSRRSSTPKRYWYIHREVHSPPPSSSSSIPTTSSPTQLRTSPYPPTIDPSSKLQLCVILIFLEVTASTNIPTTPSFRNLYTIFFGISASSIRSFCSTSLRSASYLEAIIPKG